MRIKSNNKAAYQGLSPKPIHLGTSKTKAYTINGARTVYKCLRALPSNIDI